MFRPGTLTIDDAQRLNALMRTVSALDKLSVAAPLSVTRAAGVPSISLNPLFFQWVLLCEVTAVTTGDHTVKRLTYSSGIVDYSPATTYTSCRSATGTDLDVGTVVMMFPIPDATGNYWIVPVYSFNEICLGVADCISDTITDGILERICVVKTDGYVSDIKWASTEDECVIVGECSEADPPCGELDPIVTLCCSGTPVPQTLTATFTDGTVACPGDYDVTDCTGLTGTVVTLTYDALNSWWQGTAAYGSGNEVEVRVYCGDVAGTPTWFYYVGNSTVIPGCGGSDFFEDSFDSATCGPFNATACVGNVCDGGDCYPYLVVTE